MGHACIWWRSSADRGKDKYIDPGYECTPFRISMMAVNGWDRLSQGQSDGKGRTWGQGRSGIQMEADTLGVCKDFTLYSLKMGSHCRCPGRGVRWPDEFRWQLSMVWKTVVWEFGDPFKSVLSLCRGGFVQHSELQVCFFFPLFIKQAGVLDNFYWPCRFWYSLCTYWFLPPSQCVSISYLWLITFLFEYAQLDLSVWNILLHFI